MSPIETVLALLVAVAALAWAASRLRVPYPIFLVLGGLAVSFVPGLPRVELKPEVVFVLFLPPLLYYAGLQTTWRDFKSNLRPISLLAVGLVLFTTVVVAAVAHALVDGLTWPAAFVLGAIVSPPDAVAATAILQRLRIPKRVIVILEGESLVNDATALVAYQIAVAAVAGGAFSLWGAGGRFLLVGVGGVAVGYAAGVLVSWVRPRLHDTAVESVVSLLTPFVAYLPAEWLHVSGVLAAVTAGIYVGRRVPQIATPQTRLRLYGVWETLIFLLNGLVFILIGLQLPAVLGRLRGYPLAALAGYAAAITAAAVLVRIAWVFTATYLPRRLSRSLRDRDPPPPWKHTFLVSWVALRGIVSLAAALALPQDFPGRDLILFITFGVILGTLVVQGLTLPPVIRALGVTGDDTDEQEGMLARLETAHAALARLEVLGFTDEGAADLIARVRVPYEERVRYLSRYRNAPPGGAMEGGQPEVPCRTVGEVQRVALTAEREMVIRLRDTGAISDEVLRRVQQQLDLEESRLGTAGGEDGG